MCNVLLVTCNSDSMTSNLRSTALDAIGVIGQAERNYRVRERHLYARAIPTLGENVIAALRTSPDQRSDAQWKAAACTDLLVHEVRAADVVVIAVPFENGGLPKELAEWSVHVGLAARCFDGNQTGPQSRGKVAIVIAEIAGDDPSAGTRLSLLCEDLREHLSPLGVNEVVPFEAEANGYPLRRAPLMLVVSRSRSMH